MAFWDDPFSVIPWTRPVSRYSMYASPSPRSPNQYLSIKRDLCTLVNSRYSKYVETKQVIVVCTTNITVLDYTVRSAYILDYGLKCILHYARQSAGNEMLTALLGNCQIHETRCSWS